jgi:DNA-binding MarR family transcriptional regulator
MPDPRPGMHQLFLREEDLREALALLQEARRALERAVRPVLASHGLGRAHHRALFLVARHPNITVTALQERLGVSMQSLNRVTAALLRAGLLRQVPGAADRRERLLSLSDSGAAVEREVTERQRALVAESFRAAGGPAVEGFRRVLQELAREAGPAPPARR